MAGGFGNAARVLDQLQRYGDGFQTGVARALVEAAEAVATLARDTYTPVDTGALRSTYRVSVDLGNLAITSADIQVGGQGSAAPYAAIVHSDLNAYHEPPTQALFLQRAADELAPEMSVRIGEEGVAAAKERAR